MPTILSIPDIIEISKVSVGLSFNYTSTKAYFGGTVIKPIPPVQIAIISSALEWGYDGGQAAQPLRNEGNYLWWMMSRWALQAQQMIDGGGGGTVIPTPSSSLLPNDLDWKVDVTASGIAPLADGERFVLLNGTGGMPDLRGFDINYFRGGVTQNTTPLGDGSTYYSWNRIIGLLQLYGSAPANGAAQSGELMRITPDRIGSSTTITLNAPETIYLSADGTYTLADGYLISRITIKPTNADTVRIGTTLNGEEIMMGKLMVANVYGNNGVSLVDGEAIADGANQTIYFTGFTMQAQINIYLLPIE